MHTYQHRGQQPAHPTLSDIQIMQPEKNQLLVFNNTINCRANYPILLFVSLGQLPLTVLATISSPPPEFVRGYRSVRWLKNPRAYGRRRDGKEDCHWPHILLYKLLHGPIRCPEHGQNSGSTKQLAIGLVAPDSRFVWDKVTASSVRPADSSSNYQSICSHTIIQIQDVSYLPPDPNPNRDIRCLRGCEGGTGNLAMARTEAESAR